jgi:hypothetical protein
MQFFRAGLLKPVMQQDLSWKLKISIFDEVWYIRASLRGKKEVFLKGGGFELTVFHLVGGHGEGGVEVAGG